MEIETLHKLVKNKTVFLSVSVLKDNLGKMNNGPLEDIAWKYYHVCYSAEICRAI